MDYYSAGDEEMGPDYASYAHTLVRRSATLPSLPKSGIEGAEPISWSGAQPLSPAYPSQVEKGAEPISWSGAQPLSPAYPSQVEKGLHPSAGQALSHSPQPTQVRYRGS